MSSQDAHLALCTAYGARGVGMRLDLALDGALSEYAAAAFSKEPTCRVVDDIVVSAFFASRNVTVRDVPYFSFDNRPWRHSHKLHFLSKQHALRSDKRDAQNARCHDALVGRDATASGSAAQAAAPSARRTGASGGPARSRRARATAARTSAIRPSMQLETEREQGVTRLILRSCCRHPYILKSLALRCYYRVFQAAKPGSPGSRAPGTGSPQTGSSPGTRTKTSI